MRIAAGQEALVLTEVVGIQLFLTNVLSPLSRGEHLTPEQYQTIIKNPSATRRLSPFRGSGLGYSADPILYNETFTIKARGTTQVLSATVAVTLKKYSQGNEWYIDKVVNSK